MVNLEYIWIDGVEPTNQLRSKTKIVKDDDWNNSISSCPVWCFDGSSTNQAPGNNSDCVLLSGDVSAFVLFAYKSLH